jgi:transcriptional regulator with PAS, ATPase and Fis domain
MVNGPFIRLYDLPEPLARLNRPDEPGQTVGGMPDPLVVGSLGERSLQEIMEAIEKGLIIKAMEKVGGNKLVAANLLGISRPGLYKKLQKYNLC